MGCSCNDDKVIVDFYKCMASKNWPLIRVPLWLASADECSRAPIKLSRYFVSVKLLTMW